jgi:PAS domain S-box-containing protein
MLIAILVVLLLLLTVAVAFARDRARRAALTHFLSSVRAGQSERRIAEEYRLLFEHNPHPMWVYDPDTFRFLAVNSAAIAHYGYSREEFLAMTIKDIRPQEDIPRLLEHDSGVRGTGRGGGIWRHRRRDGSIILVDIVRSMIPFGGRPARLVLAVDVTEHEQAERALREAHAMVSAVVNDAPLAIVTIDLNAHVTSWNPAAERIFGWTATEVVGRPLPYVPEVRRSEFDQHILSEVRAGRGITGFETRRVHKDGTVLDVQLNIAPLHDASGAVAGSVGFLLELTEQKRLEQQFQQAQRMEAVGRLAGGIAHDFNNLLTIINTNCELALDALPPGAEIRADIEEARQAGTRGAALTRQLLAFSRRQVLHPELIDLSVVVSGMEKMLRRVLGEDVTLECDLSTGLPHVRADLGQLEQVLMNLVLNSRDAMPDGGRITISASPAQVDADMSRREAGLEAGSYVILTVADTGAGMDAATRDRIFEPFFTTKGVGKGTGLGLAMVYGVVKQSGGSIRVESEPGRGTSITIYFPVSAALEDSGAGYRGALPTRDATPRGSETVLIVEDEGAVRDVVRRVLTAQGYTVLEAAGGAEALAVAARHPARIHLVLSDVVMPNMNGRELVEQLRAVRPGLRVLFMSGYDDDAIAQRGVPAPDTAFIEKPFTIDALARRVRAVLDEAGRQGDGEIEA